jgi:hypothetical protein
MQLCSNEKAAIPFPWKKAPVLIDASGYAVSFDIYFAAGACPQRYSFKQGKHYHKSGICRRKV